MLGKLPVPGRPTIWITVGQGPIVLAVGAGGGCLDIFTLIFPFSPLSPSLWETARYRLKYCLKGPLNPKQPTNQSTNPKKSNPWYIDDCKNAISQRKHALAKFCKYPTKENLNKVKIQRAKARRTIRSSKRNTWKSYVSNLNYKTPIKKVWNMLRKISGKTKSPNYTHLNTSREKGW